MPNLLAEFASQRVDLAAEVRLLLERRQQSPPALNRLLSQKVLAVYALCRTCSDAVQLFFRTVIAAALDPRLLQIGDVLCPAVQSQIVRQIGRGSVGIAR